MSVDVTPYRASGRLEGRCLCRAVRITVEGDHIGAVGACHCAMCRRWSGVVFGAFEASVDAVTIEGEVATYRSTEFSERAFCPRCGSHLWLRNVPDGTEYELMPGLFADAEGFPLISEIYIDRAPDYARLTGEHATATRAEYEARAPHVEGDDP